MIVDRPDAPAGWYADPREPAFLKFWDGKSWTPRRARELTAREPMPHAASTTGETESLQAGLERWDREMMQRRGFRGFVPFAKLPHSDVPRLPGVYCVLRETEAAPAFLEDSPAGHFKGKDPTVSVAELRSAWVAAARVVYMGKAGAGADGKRGLRKRLDEYRAFGSGRPVGHYGGRRIWQLADSAELIVGWMTTPDEEAATVERDLLTEFAQQYGQLPFANMR